MFAYLAWMVPIFDTSKAPGGYASLGKGQAGEMSPSRTTLSVSSKSSCTLTPALTHHFAPWLFISIRNRPAMWNLQLALTGKLFYYPNIRIFLPKVLGNRRLPRQPKHSKLRRRSISRSHIQLTETSPPRVPWSIFSISVSNFTEYFQQWISRQNSEPPLNLHISSRLSRHHYQHPEPTSKCEISNSPSSSLASRIPSEHNRHFDLGELFNSYTPFRSPSAWTNSII